MKKQPLTVNDKFLNVSNAYKIKVQNELIETEKTIFDCVSESGAFERIKRRDRLEKHYYFILNG